MSDRNDEDVPSNPALSRFLHGEDVAEPSEADSPEHPDEGSNRAQEHDDVPIHTGPVVPDDPVAQDNAKTSRGGGGVQKFVGIIRSRVEKANEKRQAAKQASVDSQSTNEPPPAPEKKKPRISAARKVILGAMVLLIGYGLLTRGGDQPEAPTDVTASNESATEVMDQNAEANSDATAGAGSSFEEDGSFGDTTEDLPSLPEVDFEPTQEKVNEDVAATIAGGEEPAIDDELTALSGEQMAGANAGLPDTEESVTGSQVANGGEAGVGEADEEDASEISEAENVGAAEGAETADASSEDAVDTAAMLPEAIAPSASSEASGLAERSDQSESESAPPSSTGAEESASPPEGDVANGEGMSEMRAQRRRLEEQLKQTRKEVASLVGEVRQMRDQVKSESGSGNRAEARGTGNKARAPEYRKPPLKVMAIGVTRYCENCLPFANAMYNDKEVTLTDGDWFMGYAVDIRGDRVLLVRADEQHSYYPAP